MPASPAQEAEEFVRRQLQEAQEEEGKVCCSGCGLLWEDKKSGEDWVLEPNFSGALPGWRLQKKEEPGRGEGDLDSLTKNSTD